MVSPTNDVISVSVPARAGSVHVRRAVTTSVAARLPITFDGIEDLRLAVDEACAWLLARGRAATGMTLRLRPLHDRLEAEVSIDAADGPWPPPDLEQSLPWRILSALVDTLSLSADAGGPSILLTKRTLEPSRTT
jgi:serine/threonine-protein kinase RsbW